MNYSKRVLSVTLLLATAAALLLSGCKEVETDLKFNHALHVQDMDLGCDYCHGGGGEESMTNPPMEKCGECHEIDMANPSEECLKCHTVASREKGYTVEHGVPEKPGSYEDLFFSHGFHAGIECAICHGSVSGKSRLIELEWPMMGTCQNCHDGNLSSAACASCHLEIRREKAPENHHGDWALIHGEESYFDESCKYCHSADQKFCVECHQTEKPKDHKIFNWKTTQHGVEATHDRRLCATCHVASYCSDCHKSQEPISHKRGDWISYRHEPGHAEAAHRNFRSCNVCHATEDCMECHTNYILRQMRHPE